MNKEPEYKDKNVYDLDSLVQYDQTYFFGCLKHKLKRLKFISFFSATISFYLPAVASIQFRKGFDS